MASSFKLLWMVFLWIFYSSPFGRWKYCGLVTEATNATFQCPTKCVCSVFAERVDCSGQNLTSVPKNLSRNTTHLDLGKNNITRLPEDVFKNLVHLKELRLVSNNLRSLPRKIFRNVRLLQILWLHGNSFTKVPKRAIQNLKHLRDLKLDANYITYVPADSFSNMRNLKNLWLDGNRLKEIPVEAINRIPSLEALNLALNKITKIPAYAFQNMSNLAVLILHNTLIQEVSDNAFEGLTHLKFLEMNSNELKKLPVAFKSLTSLQDLNLSFNKIKKIPDYTFQNMSNLKVLTLHNNLIEEVSDDAFEGLGQLTVLELNSNKIKHLPVAFKSLPSVQEINIDSNLIEYLPDYSFRENKELCLLQLHGNPIVAIGKKAFSNLPKLKKIHLSEARDMTDFPNLEGTSNLNGLHFDRASLRAIPPYLCKHSPKLRSFDVHSNRIAEIPLMANCIELLNLDLGNNKLTSLEGQLFRGLYNLTDLTLSHNYIMYVPKNAFAGLGKLLYLDLAYNKIQEIHYEAFIPLVSLEDLNLGENHISRLPTDGLQNLYNLKTYHNTELKEFPPKETFPKIKRLILSYAYHCCDFIQPEREQDKIELKEDVVWLGGKDEDHPMGLWEAHENLSTTWETIDSLSPNASAIAQGLFDNFGTYDDEAPDFQLPLDAAEILVDYKPREDAYDLVIGKPPIACKPMPGPFMPCDDLFGWWSLRCGVWFVFMLALVGNGVVLFVSVTSRSKMDVPRFLICNLACADFFMGVYLGFLAIVDASTLGEFKKHAIWWQLSPGCVTAGFLGVLSSELSVFTLTVITLERFYAITHAMQLNKRLSLRHAGYIMLGGWLYSTVLASLPLFGISDYRKFAVCLPFDIDDVFSKGYVCFIMVFNGISFFIILSCYLIMYLSIRDSQAWNSNDTRVAKRMALLVFTDFICWAPIAFLSLAETFGKNLIHLNEAKILTIFVLPLNSCANPFLYAIFTKQFKKDCVLLCRRLEDSSIARHFSRVSNRHVSMSWGSSQRPSGMNSLVPGEKRGSNSNSLSTGSNFGGVLNYNADINCGKDGEKNETEDKHVNFKDSRSAARRCSRCKCRPSKEATFAKHSKNKKNNCKNSEAKKVSSRGICDSHIILHQEFSSKDKIGDDLNCTTETCLTGDGEEERHSLKNTWKMPVSEKSTHKSQVHNCKSSRQITVGKGQISLPVVTFCEKGKVNFHASEIKHSSRKNLWKRNIPCCSTESSPVDPEKFCDYDISLMMNGDQGEMIVVSNDRLMQCGFLPNESPECQGQEKSSPNYMNVSQPMFSMQFDNQEGQIVHSSSKKRHKCSPAPHSKTCIDADCKDSVSLLPFHGNASAVLGECPVVQSKRREKIDKKAHLQFFTQSLAEHDFMQSSVCRSNSLVELTQPQLVELYRPPSKRFSLTPGQEGYILLNSANRDSAYVEGDDDFDFSHHVLENYVDDEFFIDQCKKTRQRKITKPRRQAPMEFADEGEVTHLLCSDSPVHETLLEESKGSALNLSSNRSCDKESGFNSEN